MSYETVLFDLVDDVATVTLNRPARMNALVPRMFADVQAAIDEALGHGARALILTGAGDAFCSGADLVDAATQSASGDAGDALERDYNPLARRLAGLDIPIVTALNGPAVGAGLGLALHGDIVVAARSAHLLLAFVNIGLVPDAGSTWLVAKGAGRAKALEMALLGERLSAEEALAAGLVTRVVDDGTALDAARTIALKLARGPSVAIGLIRKQVAAALTLDLDATLALESRNQGIAAKTADLAEAVRAFGEKRPPLFRGM